MSGAWFRDQCLGMLSRPSHCSGNTTPGTEYRRRRTGGCRETTIFTKLSSTSSTTGTNLLRTKRSQQSSRLWCSSGSTASHRTQLIAYLLPRFLICQGYFGEQDRDLREITESQVLIGRLLFTFQLGMNFNQHGSVSQSVESAGDLKVLIN